MKTLLALLFVTMAVAAGYWKTQYPDATLDDVKLGATNTLERAKSGFATFKDGAPIQNFSASEQQLLNSRVADLEGSVNSRLEALEASLKESSAATEENDENNGEADGNALDPTVVNGRLTDVERQLKAYSYRLSQISESVEPAEQAPQAAVVNAVVNEETEQKLTKLNTTVDALAEQIDTVSSSLGNLNDNVAASVTEREAMTANLGALQTSVDTLSQAVSEQDDEQTLTNIGTRIDSMDARFTELAASSGKALDEVAVELASVSQQASAIESRINTLSVSNSDTAEGAENLTALVDQRLQSIEAKLSTADADSLRLDTLINRLEQTTEQVTDLSSEQRSTSEQVAALSSAQQAAVAAGSVASGNAESTNERIAKLLTELETNAQRTAELETRLEAANVQMASMSEELAAVRAQAGTGSSSIESLQAELNAQLETINSRIDNTDASTDISTLSESLVTARNRIQQLESRVQSLPTGDSEAAVAKVAQDELQALVETMEKRFSELPNATDPQLLNRLTQVQKQVAELRERGANTGIEYTVYFGLGSIDISPEAAEVLKEFIKDEQNRTTGVSIYGFTDRRGDATFNQRLALARATSVRSFLITNGFDFTKIKSLSGLGEDAAAATLADGVADADQRAVVLVADQP